MILQSRVNRAQMRRFCSDVPAGTGRGPLLRRECRAGPRETPRRHRRRQRDKRRRPGRAAAPTDSRSNSRPLSVSSSSRCRRSSGPRCCDDEPLPHELAQYPVQALFRDAQNAEQFADRHLRVAADEMHDPVMRPPEAVLREDRVGLRGKVPIGEEQQLDALANRLVARFPAAPPRAFGVGYLCQPC